MFGINLKHSLATVAVVTGFLAAAGSASAGSHGVLYTGHAGLGASVYQHNQTDREVRLGSKVAAVSDGTSNTIMFGTRAVIESIGTKYTMVSPLLPDIDDEVLLAVVA